jgi:hypothetical protein
VGRVVQLVKLVELKVKGGGGPGFKSWQRENCNIYILTTNNLSFKKKIFKGREN